MTWLAILRLIGGWRAAAFLGLSVILGVALTVQSWRLDSTQGDLANEKAEFQAYRDRLTAATAKVAALAAKAREEYQELSARAESNYQAGRDSAEQHQAAVVADLRSGNLRLRDEWRSCMSRSPAEQSPAGAAKGPDGPAEVPAEAFGRVLRIGSDADNQVTWLQAELLATRQLAQQCGRAE